MSAPGRATAGGVDPASVVAFRVLFGGLVAVAIARYFVHGWIHEQFEVPRFFFAYEGLEWVKPLPAPWMRALFALVGVCGLLVAIGLVYRVAAALLAVGFTWIHLCDKTNYLNHYHLISLLAVLVAVLPLHAVGSLDARLRPRIRRTAFPPLVLPLLRLQIGAVYLFSGLAKLESDWLLRAEPLRTWLSASEGVPVVGPWLGAPLTAYAAAWAGAVFDLVVPFALLARRARTLAFVALVSFHAATAVLFPIGLFPVFMTAFATVLLAPSWPRALRLPGVRGDSPAPVRAPASGIVARIAFAAWILVQALVPLRFLLHGRDVNWTEEGFRFAWRVMLIDKSAHARFEVTDPTSGERVERDGRDLVTAVQARHASTQPDMILALARRIGADEAARRGHAVEVRAIVDVAYDGRPSRPYVDSTLDLMRARGAGLPSGWVLPPP